MRPDSPVSRIRDRTSFSGAGWASAAAVPIRSAEVHKSPISTFQMLQKPPGLPTVMFQASNAAAYSAAMPIR